MTEPEPVAELAARGGLGALRYAQRGRNPFLAFGRGLARALGWLLGMIIVGGVAYKLDVGPLGVAAVPFLAGAVVAIIKAVRRLLVGFTAAYLYDNGLIHVRNGRLRAVPWAELDRLLLTYFAGEMVCLHVVTTGGRKLRVELESGAGDPNLAILLTEKVEELGRPIVPSGPSAKRADPAARPSPPG